MLLLRIGHRYQQIVYAKIKFPRFFFFYRAIKPIDNPLRKGETHGPDVFAKINSLVVYGNTILRNSRRAHEYAYVYPTLCFDIANCVSLAYVNTFIYVQNNIRV